MGKRGLLVGMLVCAALICQTAAIAYADESQTESSQSAKEPMVITLEPGDDSEQQAEEEASEPKMSAQAAAREYNVKDFGAKGNGRTDDQKAINACLESAKGSGSPVTVIVPAGTYIVGGYLFIYPNTTLHLESGATIKAKSSFTTGTMLGAIHLNADGAPCDPSNKACTHGGYSQAVNITIEGGTWDRGSTGDKAAPIFRLIHGDNIKVRNTTMLHASDHFINVSGSRNVTIENVTFKDFNYGFVTKNFGNEYQNEAVHTDCIKPEAMPDGYPTDKTVARNVTVKGCTFVNVPDGVGTHYPSTSVPMSSNIKVQNCTFKNIRNRAVNIYRSDGFTVDGCVAENCTSFVIGQNSKCTISNNSVNNTHKAADNKNPNDLGDAIKLLGSMAGTKITGNRIGGTQNHGIWIVDGKATIENNVSVSTVNAGSFVFDIYLSGGASGTVVKNNQVGKARGFKSNATNITDSGNGYNPNKMGKVQRLFGTGRYDTMEAIVKAGNFPTGGTVVIATGAGFKDALAAAGFAGVKNAPVILVNGTGASLNSQAKRQLQRLRPSAVYVAGGTGVVTDKIVQDIQATTGVKPVRLAGANSVLTSVALANAGAGSWSDTAVIATNKSFKDALSVAPVAYAKKMPIYLSNDGKTLAREVVASMKKLGIKKVIIVGGEGAVLPAVQKTAEANGIKVVARLAGPNGVSTSKEIAGWGLKNGMQANLMGVATSQNYPDALAGAALCGFNNSVLVLADDAAQMNATFPRPYRAGITKMYVFGGVTAVQDLTFQNIVAATC